MCITASEGLSSLIAARPDGRKTTFGSDVDPGRGSSRSEVRFHGNQSVIICSAFQFTFYEKLRLSWKWPHGGPTTGNGDPRQ